MSKRKRWLSRLVFLIGLIYIFAACTWTSSPQVLPSPTTRSAVSTIITSSTATATPLGGSLALLGPLPKDCPSSPAPQILGPDFGPAAGADLVWVGAGNFRNQAPLALIWSPTEAQFTHDQYGWSHKFLYVVATSYQGKVTIHGTNLSDGSPIYLGAQDAATTDSSTSLVLDTRSSAITNRNDKWTEFPGGLFVPKAGCYSLEATWSGGSWRITFAAGLVV